MIAVDASLAVKWVLPEEHSDKAQALYRDTVAAGERVIAPPLLPIEVTNILREKMRGAQPLLSLTDGLELLERFLAFPLELISPERLYRRALELADQHGLPAAYDAHYVAVAELLESDLWTDDRRLLRALGGSLPFVRWVGDY